MSKRITIHKMVGHARFELATPCSEYTLKEMYIPKQVVYQTDLMPVFSSIKLDYTTLQGIRLQPYRDMSSPSKPGSHLDIVPYSVNYLLPSDISTTLLFVSPLSVFLSSQRTMRSSAIMRHIKLILHLFDNFLTAQMSVGGVNLKCLFSL
jgi:hypothetical protein